jgi:hypothetical protein
VTDDRRHANYFNASKRLTARVMVNCTPLGKDMSGGIDG